MHVVVMGCVCQSLIKKLLTYLLTSFVVIAKPTLWVMVVSVFLKELAMNAQNVALNSIAQLVVNTLLSLETLLYKWMPCHNFWVARSYSQRIGSIYLWIKAYGNPTMQILIITYWNEDFLYSIFWSCSYHSASCTSPLFSQKFCATSESQHYL